MTVNNHPVKDRSTDYEWRNESSQRIEFSLAVVAMPWQT